MSKLASVTAVAPQLCIDAVGSEVLELLQLRVAEATGSIDGVENKAIGRLARDMHQLRTQAFFHLLNERLERTVVSDEDERRIRFAARESETPVTGDVRG